MRRIPQTSAGRRQPSIHCTIERRLLVNYRLDPDRVARLLPAPLRPHVVRDWAVGGACFLRLSHVRPAGLPEVLGLRSDNVAHRFAVEWDDGTGLTRTGVFVPRRDTCSRVVAAGGGRVFPGRHHLARFCVADTGDVLGISVDSADGRARLHVEAEVVDQLGGELFDGLDDAIEFFRSGCTGYSPSAVESALDCVVLDCSQWRAVPARVTSMRSNLFDDAELFPPGSAAVDSALIMRGLPCRWHVGAPLTAERAAQAEPLRAL